MGVHSLWTIVGPAAKPVKLEALSRKKLAVDALIWIYQFLKAVRDKEGNAMGASHIVGFFRRLCKMLYFGILPLFVFDGGAPALKRQVIQRRRERRQGNGESVSTTAQKLLLMRMNQRERGPSRRGESQGKRGKGQEGRKESAETPGVYFEDLPSNQTDAEPFPAENEQFRRKDEYHLPEIRQFRVKRDDQRILPAEELEEYGDDEDFDVVDGVPIDSVDPSSAAFAELPMATQYMILNHLRLRSRLRMGYSKDQLVGLFPDLKDFSRFQILQVQKRNFYTQKLMNVSGMADDGNVSKRIAGDKDRQYVLVKNEGGWTLSLGEETVDLDEEDELKERREEKREERNESQDRRESIADIKSEDVGLAQEADSDLDDLEDVPLGSDDEKNRALIESLYEQYPENAPKEKVLPKVLSVAGFSEEQLKRAVDQSKKEYLSEQYDLSKSLLFAPEKERDVSEKEKKTQDVAKTESLEEEISKEEGSREETPRKETPSWFSGSHVLDHESIGVFGESAKKQLNEEELAGLISWAEAKEYYTQVPRKEAAWIEIDENDSEEKANEKDVIEIEDEAEIEGAETEEAQNDQFVEGGEQDTIQAGDAKERRHLIELGSGMETAPDASSASNSGMRDKNSPGRSDASDRSAARECETSEQARGARNRQHTPVIQPKCKIECLHEPRCGISQIADEQEIAAQQVGDGPEKRVEEREERVESEERREREEMKEKEYGDGGSGGGDRNGESVFVYDLSEDEEEDLRKQLHEEEDVYQDFSQQILENLSIHTKVGSEQLLQEQLQKAKRDADEVTQTMVNDVQELLRRFGIPYITAPMEAEAQCAKLYQLGLVDGIVTDDSDCFLFGGSRVYKNMFNQKQYVECYVSEDIENKVGLSQQKLIDLALLLGSDYTEGIKGIGPVLAMEILAEFGDLMKFKTWFERRKNELSTGADPGECSRLEKTLIGRIRSGKLFLAADFPSETVRTAYRRPEVDADASEFRWGIPLLDQIRSFLMYNVGWTQQRVDEVMVPLVRNMNRARKDGVQSTLGEFFPQEYLLYRKDVGMGKRMKVASERMRQ